MRIGEVAKAVAGAVGMIATALVAAFADSVVDLSELSHIAAVGVTAGGGVYAVFKVRNRPPS
jgi:hypothetical protein